MSRRESQSGYSLVEVIAAMAIFAVFLLVLVSLQREFLKFDRDTQLQFFTHPAPLSVLARLRHDIVDSRGYPASQDGFVQSHETLILDLPTDDGSGRVIVWDFRSLSKARRLSYNAGARESEWTANGVPAYQIGSDELPDGKTAVRVTARDSRGRLAIDQIIAPRAE